MMNQIFSFSFSITRINNVNIICSQTWDRLSAFRHASQSIERYSMWKWWWSPITRVSSSEKMFLWNYKISNVVSQKLDKPGKNPYESKPGEKPYELEIVWRNVLLFIVLHAMAVYGFYIPAKAGTWWISKLIHFTFSLCISCKSIDYCSNCLGAHWFVGNSSRGSSLLVS